jgi:hypothetical protein
MNGRICVLLASLLLTHGLGCGGPDTPDTPPDDGRGTTEPADPAERIPEALRACRDRVDTTRGTIEVHFDCGTQVVSYYESAAHIEHIAVLEPLLATPGFRVDVESREIMLAGRPQLASILYHTDELSNELIFALYIVTQDLASGGTRVISCSMVPAPEQVAWCDEAIISIARLGVGL